MPWPFPGWPHTPAFPRLPGGCAVPPPRRRPLPRLAGGGAAAHPAGRGGDRQGHGPSGDRCPFSPWPCCLHLNIVLRSSSSRPRGRPPTHGTPGGGWRHQPPQRPGSRAAAAGAAGQGGHGRAAGRGAEIGHPQVGEHRGLCMTRVRDMPDMFLLGAARRLEVPDLGEGVGCGCLLRISGLRGCWQLCSQDSAQLAPAVARVCLPVHSTARSNVALRADYANRRHGQSSIKMRTCGLRTTAWRRAAV